MRVRRIEHARGAVIPRGYTISHREIFGLTVLDIANGSHLIDHRLRTSQHSSDVGDIGKVNLVVLAVVISVGVGAAVGFTNLGGALQTRVAEPSGRAVCIGAFNTDGGGS